MLRSDRSARNPAPRRLKRAALLLAAAMAFAAGGAGAEEARRVPPPTLDEPAATTGATETAVLAGGCFWGVQGVFQHVDGVKSAVSGYAGGEAATAQYETVGTGSTGHAEAVKISFDPAKVSYGTLLRIYFSVAHDPTQLNRQGPDRGPQYRSAIFPTSEAQARVARAYIDELGKGRVFPAAIVTRIELDRPFYPAEDYHQDFLTLNPSYPYIVINDLPKIKALKALFPERYRAEPVLVAATGVN
jgi:peptide-methionine (S)-S-oxide reductase